MSPYIIPRIKNYVLLIILVVIAALISGNTITVDTILWQIIASHDSCRL